jgi:DNA-binding CsgD family transcriptional regulator
MLVRIICVGADGLSHQHLLRLLDCSEDELLLRVRAVTESSLVKECGTRYVPRHGLLREVVNDDMLHAERQTLHRRIARILADDGQVLARELAYHWRAAGENALAVEAGILAAQQAADANAWVDGWREWRLVVAELESGPLSASYLLAAAHAAHQAGQDLSAIDLIRRVERMDPTEVPLDAIQIKLRRAEYLAAAGQLADAASFYRGILAEMRADSEILSHVRTLYGEVLLRVGEIAEAQRMAELALANVVNKQTEVAAHRVLALCCLRSGRPMEAKSHLERALAMATETHDAGGIGAVSLDLANLLGGVLAELEEGVSVARVGALAVLDARGALIIAIKLRAAEMKILFRLGRWQEAAEVARQTMRDDPTGSAGADALLAHIRVRLAIGDLQSAERDLRRAATLLADRAHDPETVTLAILRAGYFMWCNDPISARNIVAICMNELDGSEDDATIATLLWHGIRAEAEACAAGMKADDECLISLAQLNDRLRAGIERALEPPSEVLLAYEDLYDAELSRVSGHSDPALWEAAARRWELNGHPYPAAYSYLRQAEAAFARRTRNADAAAALRHAAALAMKLEARPLLELIMDLADRARVKLLDQPRGPEPTRVPSARADGLALLTDREREVVEHVARGMSNRQIGKALFISPGTVAAHVTHCLRKLDVGTRVELAAMLVRSTTSHD